MCHGFLFAGFVIFFFLVVTGNFRQLLNEIHPPESLSVLCVIESYSNAWSFSAVVNLELFCGQWNNCKWKVNTILICVCI